MVIRLLAWSVGQLVTFMSPAKMAELIEMLFRMVTWVGSRNHALYVYPDLQIKRYIFWGEVAAPCKVCGLSTVSCAKLAEPITMPFGMWSWVGPKNHVFEGGHDP